MIYINHIMYIQYPILTDLKIPRVGFNVSRKGEDLECNDKEMLVVFKKYQQRICPHMSLRKQVIVCVKTLDSEIEKAGTTPIF